MDELNETAGSAEETIEYPALALKKGEDSRLRAGHSWIFSNEVDVRKTPLSSFEPGQAAVRSSSKDSRSIT